MNPAFKQYVLCILATGREISVLSILRPHQNGPYQLFSILKGLFLSLISFKISGVFHLAPGYELSYTDTLMARMSVILLSMNCH